MKNFILTAAAILIFFFLFIPLVKAEYTLETDFPTIGGQQPSTDLVQFIRYLYLFALSAVGVAAFGALVFGGFKYLLAAGSVGSTKEATEWIWGAIYGLILALAAVLILRTINPDLINLKGPKPPTIQPSAVQTQTQSILQEGDSCTPSTPPFCDYGLECKNNKCVLTQSGQTQQTGNWLLRSDCMRAPGTCYGDSFCAVPKPSSGDYCCCK